LAQRYPKALVTGVTSGLGQAFCKRLLAEGVEVWGTSRDAARIQAQPGLHPCTLDLARPDSLQQLLEQLEPVMPELSLLINNAGSGTFGPVKELPPEALAREFEVLVQGPVQLIRALAPHLLKQRQAAVVNVTSLARDFPLPYFASYNAAKAALSNFSRSLQLEWQGTGLSVIDFMPGDYRTRFNEAATRPQTQDPRACAAWAAIERHLQAAPGPDKAAEDLCRALLKGRSGVVVSGDFFQARVAPLLARGVPWSVVRWAICRYYRL
jgi:NAD(P)-dependent dehydrogenase (short-subunit alcohol dehydrogenase family)